MRKRRFTEAQIIGMIKEHEAGSAIGAACRMMDELAALARTKTGRAGLSGESDKLWFDHGRAEARVRAARAFLFEVWREVEDTIEAGNRVSTRQISLILPAKSDVHEAGAEACNFAYRVAGGASLRRGVMLLTAILLTGPAGAEDSAARDH